MLKKIILLSLISNYSNAETNKTVSNSLQGGLNQLSPKAQIKSTAKTPINGVSEIMLGDAISPNDYFMTDDGKYLISGNIVETKTGKNITFERKKNVRKEKLSKFDKTQSINFHPDTMKHHITVFTDIDCGYCRKLHNQMEEYNDLGIGISYLLYPRSGIDSPSYDKAVTVWCSEDKNTAMTKAQSGMAIEPKKCDNPIKDQYIAGQKSGVNGTPNIVTDNGTLIPTYMAPKALLQKLNQIQASE